MRHPATRPSPRRPRPLIPSAHLCLGHDNFTHLLPASIAMALPEPWDDLDDFIDTDACEFCGSLACPGDCDGYCSSLAESSDEIDEVDL